MTYYKHLKTTFDEKVLILKVMYTGAMQCALLNNKSINIQTKKKPNYKKKVKRENKKYKIKKCWCQQEE